MSLLFPPLHYFALEVRRLSFISTSRTLFTGTMTGVQRILSTTVALHVGAAALCGGGVAAFVPSPADVTTYRGWDVNQNSIAASTSGRRRKKIRSVLTITSSRHPHMSSPSRGPHRHHILRAKSDSTDDGSDISDSEEAAKKLPADTSSQTHEHEQERTMTSKNDASNVDLSKIGLSKMEYSRAERIVKAKTELDKIMNGPDPPFDAAAAVSSLVGGVQEPLDADSPEAKREEEVHAVETELFTAIADGNYDKAETLKDQLGNMHFDDYALVLSTNSAFYRAFSDKDYEAMSKLWLHDKSACCIHPSHTPLVGAKEVLNSWDQMFTSGDQSFQHNKMEPNNVRLTIKGMTAVLTCDEEVYTRRFVRGRKRQTELVNRLTATNIFRKVGNKWHMVHHHSSWHADSEAARNALAGQMGSRSRKSGRTSDDVPFLTAEDALGIPRNEGISGKGYGEKGSSSSSDKKRGIEGLEGLSGLGMDGLSGLGGGLGGGDGSNGPVRRVFMGSLSDLLNGGLNNIINDSVGPTIKDGGEEGTIIQFSSSDDDDDDDSNDGDPIIVRHIGKNDDGKNSASSSNSGAPKDQLRQNCITALRKLAAQGEISSKQKRVLLTDIITCSAKGEFSMVEVAYELLCGEGEEDSKDVAEEDFAEQCRVFASALSDHPGSASK